MKTSFQGQGVKTEEKPGSVVAEGKPGELADPGGMQADAAKVGLEWELLAEDFLGGGKEVR